MRLNAHREILDLFHLKDGQLSEDMLKEVFSRYDLLDSSLTLGYKSLELYQFYKSENSANEPFKDPKTETIITQFSLAYFANIFLISNSNPYKKKKFFFPNNDNIPALINLYFNKLIDPALLPETELKDYDSFVSTFIRMNFEQLSFQTPPLYPLSRQIYIFDVILREDPLIDSINILELFHSHVGLSIPDFFILSIFLLVVANQKPFFNLDSILKSNLPKYEYLLSEKNLNDILEFYAIYYKDFKNEDRSLNSIDRIYTKFRFNPLVLYPIIKFDDAVATYIIPNIFLLENRFANGLFWWCDSHFKDKGIQNRFREYYGMIFQKYVGIILKSIYGNDQIKSEFTYGQAKIPFIDWYMIEDDKLYLFEVKSYQFNLLNNQLGIKENIIKEELKKIIYSVIQINKRINDISLYDELSHLRSKKIIPVIVFLNFPLISTNIYNQWLEELGEYQTLKKYGYLPYKNLFMLNIEELELYDDVKELISLEEIFSNIVKDSQHNFISFLLSIKPGKLRNRFLDNFFKDYWGINL